MWKWARFTFVWGLSLLLAVGLILSGIDRIRLTPTVVTQFDAFGYSLLFARLVGVYEILGAIALLIPRFSIFAGAALTLLMIGAISTHVISGFGSPFHASRAIAFLAVIVGIRFWERRVKETT